MLARLVELTACSAEGVVRFIEEHCERTRCAPLLGVVGTVCPFVRYVAVSTWIASERVKCHRVYMSSALTRWSPLHRRVGRHLVSINSV